MERVEVGGLRIAYERAGRGPPLVLLHGFVGTGVGTWREQIDALSDDFTVVAWDAPGAGASSAAPERFRAAEYADCLAAFVAALGLGRAHVAGLSFGGTIALALQRRHPGVPLTLMLLGAYAGWAGSLPPETVRRRLRESLRVADLPVDELVGPMLPTMFSPSAAPERVDAFAATMAGIRRRGFRVMARASAEADLRDGLGGVDVPTLLLYGDADVRAPVAVGEALQAAIPGARLVVLPGVGHASPVEAPELVTAELRAFLRRAGRRAAGRP